MRDNEYRGQGLWVFFRHGDGHHLFGFVVLGAPGTTGIGLYKCLVGPGQGVLGVGGLGPPFVTTHAAEGQVNPGVGAAVKARQ